MATAAQARLSLLLRNALYSSESTGTLGGEEREGRRGGLGGPAGDRTEQSLGGAPLGSRHGALPTPKGPSHYPRPADSLFPG